MKSRPRRSLITAVAVGTILIGVFAAVAVRRRATPAREPSPAAGPGAAAQAQSLARAGRFDQAIFVLEGAIRKGPYDETLHYTLGEAMMDHASPDAMIAFFSAEVARDEKPQTSHYFWAIGLARKGETSAAIAQLQQALDIDPAHEMSQRIWGVLLERQGNLEGALEHYAEAVKIHPEYTDGLRDAARVAAKLGRASEAEGYARRVRTADPGSPRRYLYWARYLHGHGRDPAARAELDHLLSLDPDNAEGRRLRDAIDGAGSGPRGHE